MQSRIRVRLVPLCEVPIWEFMIWSCGNNSPRETDTCHKVKTNFGDPKFSQNLRFFGRADLWISQSRAKFDEEVDFEVRLGVALQKRRQIGKKQNFQPKNFADFFFSASKNETLQIVWNALWQSFATIRAVFDGFRNFFHLQSPVGNYFHSVIST